MRVIGVMDVLGGHAVHARTGPRANYARVERAGNMKMSSGDAVALARVYLDRLGVKELYLADLDAISGGPPNEATVEAIAVLGAPLWVDGGTTSVEEARRILRLGAARVIVGLETLASYEQLVAICADVGSHRVAFSLDLRDGEPLIAASRRSA